LRRRNAKHESDSFPRVRAVYAGSGLNIDAARGISNLICERLEPSPRARGPRSLDLCGRQVHFSLR